MEGEIGVDSELGKGATFWVNLPFSRDKGSKKEGVKENRLEKRRILLYDTHTLSRLAIKHTLAGWDAIISDVISEEALSEKLIDSVERKNPYDLVVLGLSKQELDTDAASKLIKLTQELVSSPIVVITSTSERHVLKNLRKKGAELAFSRPFRRKHLLEKIRQNLKPGQYSLGPTFLVVNLSMIPPFRTENMVLRPAYCDDYLFPKAVSGELWFVAFGRPGAPILGIPEFEGTKCVESTMEKLGILVDEEYSFLKGVLFIIHPWRRPAEIWGLERLGLAEELSESNSSIVEVLRNLTGTNWNDEADTNGWQLTGAESKNG